MTGFSAVSQDSWLPPPKQLIPDRTGVDVWCASLDQTPRARQKLLDSLSPDERQRAGRFHFQRDRDRYVIARGALREILSFYLATSPANLRFVYSKHGKPSLRHEIAGEPLHFNLSHAHEFALYAVSKGCELGVDIEYMRSDFASLEIAERFFSSYEVAMLRSLPVDLRSRGFFNCWTRKEAYIKGIGEGLSHPLNSFAVSLIPGEPVRLHTFDSCDVSGWSLIPISFRRDYVAALAIKGRASTINFWDWSQSARTGDHRVVARR